MCFMTYMYNALDEMIAHIIIFALYSSCMLFGEILNLNNVV